MGSVLRKDGFNVVIRTADHLPPHVHVLRAGGEVKITLGDAATDPEVVDSWGISDRDVNRAFEIVDAHQEYLIDCWRRIHG